MQYEHSNSSSGLGQTLLSAADLGKYTVSYNNSAHALTFKFRLLIGITRFTWMASMSNAERIEYSDIYEQACWKNNICVTQLRCRLTLVYQSVLFCLLPLAQLRMRSTRHCALVVVTNTRDDPTVSDAAEYVAGILYLDDCSATFHRDVAYLCCWWTG